MPNTSVFQRIEKKYRISAATRQALEEALASRLCHSPARDGMVTSIYLDTPDHHLIGRSLEKPPYKEKLRLRAYGTANGAALMRAFAPVGARLAPEETAAPVFLEVKMKLDGVGYKRRLALPLGAARQFLAGAPLSLALAAFPSDAGTARLDRRKAQIGREIAALISRYGQLDPSVAVRCQREAWGADDAAGGLRVTFDQSLEYAIMADGDGRPAPSPASGCATDGIAWRQLIAPDESIMEAKAAGAFPLWLAHLLDRAHAFPQSFSKCGAAARLAFAHPARKEGATHA